MVTDAITVKRLTKVFNKNSVALDHIHFTVREGKILGSLRSNGAGKTTKINILISVRSQLCARVLNHSHTNIMEISKQIITRMISHDSGC